MISQNKILVIRQLDQKINKLRLLKDVDTPEGWVHLIRKTLQISLRQLGDRLSITPQSVRDVEVREASGTITLQKLKETAEALDMTLVYGFIPKKGSLENLIGHKARALAERIVNRTSTTMKLEDQQNSQERIEEAIAELTAQLKKEMPKSLWD